MSLESSVCSNKTKLLQIANTKGIFFVDAIQTNLRWMCSFLNGTASEQNEFVNTIDSAYPKVAKKIIPVVIGDKVVPLILIIEQMGKYLTINSKVTFPTDYDSDFATATNRTVAHTKLSPHMQSRYEDYTDAQAFLHSFYSERQGKYGQLQNERERHALRGVATKMLCATLQHAVETGLLEDRQIMGVEASGRAPGAERAKLAETIYEPLGFVKKFSIGGGDWYMQTTVDRLIKNCQNIF